MPEYYNMVLNEDELHWFFDHIIEKPEPSESYMVCLACRGKKLTDEEREYTKVGSRGEMMREELIRTKGGLAREWNFDIFKQAFYRYNCDKNSLLTSTHVPYPEHAMLVYMVVNPSDEMNCIEDLIYEYNTRRRDMTNAARKNSQNGITDSLVKMPKVAEHLKSCHALNCPRRVWIDYDFDIKKVLRNDTARADIYEALHDEGMKIFGKGNFAIIKTSGGFHTLAKKSCLHSNPHNFIDNVTEKLLYRKLIHIPVAQENLGGGTVRYSILTEVKDGQIINEEEKKQIYQLILKNCSQGEVKVLEDRITFILNTSGEDTVNFFDKVESIVKPYDEFVINPRKSKEQDKEHPWRVKGPMIPTPGCRQYDSYPIVMNKEDFND